MCGAFMHSFNHIAIEDRAALTYRYRSVRGYTLEICSCLENEDFIVQPTAEVSPPKWHLGHTTWFFEELLLVRFLPEYTRFNETYRLLFNSYYKSAGEHWLQGDRGILSRPTVSEIKEYRHYVDNYILEFLVAGELHSDIERILDLGLNHEQQHQELLYMDIKFILGANPLLPLYSDEPLPRSEAVADKWRCFEEDVYQIGHDQKGFAYDNEVPKHKTYIQSYLICEATVTNGDFLAFINDQAYAAPEHWLSLGWDWVEDNRIQCPLYWKKEGKHWYEFTLHGLQTLDLNAPVTHVSYFEADAFARWKGARLPTEQELEVYLNKSEAKLSDGIINNFHPSVSDDSHRQVWCWTSSHYSPYPRYQPFHGMLEEYNSKFMCNQFVLKGGCIVTPVSHYRHTYRNFFPPHQRWMFSGIRLAKDNV